MLLAAALALSMTASTPAPVLAAIVIAPTEATDITPTIEDAPGLFNVMIEAFQNKNWPLAVGALALLLSLLIAGINAAIYKLTAVTDETRKKILPWLAAVGGCLTAFGLPLIAGVGWVAALVAGFVTSASAVLLWQLAGKRIKNALTKKADG